MNVGFTPHAYDDLRAIRYWIAVDDARAADRVVSRIVQTAMMFGSFPLLGRAGRVEGTREFSVAGLPYPIVYAIASESDLKESCAAAITGPVSARLTRNRRCRAAVQLSRVGCERAGTELIAQL